MAAHWRYLPALAVLVLGFAASIYAFNSSTRQAATVERLRYQQEVDEAADHVRNYMRSQELVASAFAALLTISPGIDQAEFEAFADRVVHSYPSLVAVNWFPRVAPWKLGSIEAELRARDAPRPHVRTADGERIDPASLDGDAFPVMLTTPLEQNRNLLGFDVASSPLRRPALERARDTGIAVSSEPVRLVQLPVVGTNLYAPVYSAAANRLDSVRARREALSGYISVAFRVDALVRDALPGKPELFRIHLFDADAAPGERYLSSIFPRDGVPSAAGPAEDLLGRTDLERRTIHWGQREWALIFEPEPSALAEVADDSDVPALALGIVLTATLATYLVSLERTRRRVQDANERLAVALAEKEVLFKEIHHRIKNNLQVTSSLLQMQALQFDDHRVRAAFQDTQSRLQSVGLIHDILYSTESVTRVDLGAYLARLTKALAASYGAEERGITVRLDLKPATVDMQRAVPVALAVTEVLTNAFKHAFPPGRAGEVCVGVEEVGGEYHIVVKDTGNGMPEPQARGKGLGQTLIRTLVTQVGGRFTFSNEGGTVFRMAMPARIEFGSAA